MLVPAIAILGGVLGWLLLMTRKNVTWANTSWIGIGLAILAGLVVGWILDSRTHFTVLLKLGLHGSAANGGETMFLGVVVFLLPSLVAAFVAMAASVQKSGNLVD